MLKKTEIAAQWKKHKGLSKRGLSAQYDNTRLCQQFYDGDFMSYRDNIQFVDGEGRRKRAMVQFNKVKPNVDAVVGFMAQNRRQAKYVANVPNNPSQNLYSKYMNALSGYVRSNANADHLETEQDADMMINGYGAVETDISYIQGNATTDPNGEILMMKLAPMCMGWDPHARQKNLIGARWAYYYEDYDLKEALQLFQGSTDIDFEPVVNDIDSGGYQYNPYGGLYDKIKLDDSVEWSNQTEEMVRVYNYQWLAYETFYRAKNPIYTLTNPQAVLIAQAKMQIIAAEVLEERKKYTINSADYGDMFDFDPSKEELVFDEKTKAKLVREFGDLIDPVGFKRKCFYTAVISGEHVFTCFKSICQQGFSIKFKTGTYNATAKIWVGMVNSMMEPAKYYNKALTELLFTIASNSKGGVMIERDAVEDVADFSSKWAKTDAVIVMEPGSLASGKVQEKARPAMPTGLETIVSLSDAAISDTAGIDRAFLGSREDKNESGILYRRRIRQIISIMARYVDSITLYQKEHARMLADYIRVWAENNDGSMFRITGEDGKDEFIKVASDKIAPGYDVSIQEASQTPEDKEETAQVLGGYGDKLLAGQDIQTAKLFYAESLQYLNIDSEVRNKLTQALQPQEGQVDPQEFAQLQAMVQELQSAVSQANVRKMNSDAELNEARALAEKAKTAKTFEEAAQTGLENDLVRTQSYSEVKVSI